MTRLEEQTELAALRARVEELETELARTQIWANQEVARAQEQTYWLDRWGLDLNAILSHPLAPRIRAGLRALRRPVRVLINLRGRLLG